MSSCTEQLTGVVNVVRFESLKLETQHFVISMVRNVDKTNTKGRKLQNEKPFAVSDAIFSEMEIREWIIVNVIDSGQVCETSLTSLEIISSSVFWPDRYVSVVPSYSVCCWSVSYTRYSVIGAVTTVLIPKIALSRLQETSLKWNLTWFREHFCKRHFTEQ